MSYAGSFVSSASKGQDSYKVGRITGLDPASLFFLGADKSVKLDKTDAEFVDVIHTDIVETYPGIPYSKF